MAKCGCNHPGHSCRTCEKYEQNLLGVCSLCRNGECMYKPIKKEYIEPTIKRKAIYGQGGSGYMGLGKNSGGPMFFDRCNSRWGQKRI